MRFANCVECKNPISYEKFPICKECSDKLKKIVKNFIRENGTQNPIDIEKATGISLNIINHFIEEGILYDINKPDDSKEKLELLYKLQNQLRDSNSKSEDNNKHAGFLSSNRKR